MRRIAIVTSHPIQYNAPLFARLSKKEGIEVKVFYTWSQTSSGSQFDPDFGRDVQWDIPLLEGYDYEFVKNTSPNPGSGRYGGIVNPGLISVLEFWRPDCILVYSWSYQSHLRVLRYFKGRTPLLFRGDSTMIDESPGIRKVARRIFLRWVYSHIDIALYVGVRNREYFSAHGLAEHQLCHVPHAVDNERFSSSDTQASDDAKRWRRSLGVSDEDRVLMFCGKLEEKKDPRSLVRLSRLLKTDRLKLFFVGEGRLKDELQREIGEDSRFRFLGFQNQSIMPVAYRMSDILILPSIHDETWGLVVNEAMACGRPVMVSEKAGCMPDLLVEGETGWVFTPGRKGESKLADILDDAVKGRIDLPAMGGNARRKVDGYSIESAADAILHCVMDL